MPHTNRKKKAVKQDEGPKIVHTKRQQIEDADGWTHVVETPRRITRIDPEKPIPSWAHAGDFEKNGVSYVNRTLEELKKDFEYHTKQWEGSEAEMAMTEKLVSVKGKVVVKDVVCLGLGSLQNARREGRRASYTQLAALRSIMKIMQPDSSLPCIFQDPQFTELDKDFLVSLGYKILDDPAAFEQITESTLVYAIHCYADVYKSVSSGPKPAILIGTDVDNFGKFNLSETIQATTASLESLVEACEQFDFPQVRHDFSDTKIYWRKAGVGKGDFVPEGQAASSESIVKES